MENNLSKLIFSKFEFIFFNFSKIISCKFLLVTLSKLISGPTKKEILLNLKFFNNSIKLSYLILVISSFVKSNDELILFWLIELESPNLKSEIIFTYLEDISLSI